MLSTLTRFTLMGRSQAFRLSRNASFFEKLVEKVEEKEKELQSKAQSISVSFGPIDHEKYKLIYSFQYVKYPAAFVKLQYPLIMFTITLWPVFRFLLENKELSTVLLITSVNQLLIMRILGIFIRDLIGAIYVNKSNEDEVIISSLNANGKRINHVHDFNDIVCNGFQNKFYQILGFAQVTVCSKAMNYKLNIKNYKIHDVKLFGSLLGDIPRVK